MINLETLSMLNKVKNKTENTSTMATKKLYLSETHILSPDSWARTPTLFLHHQCLLLVSALLVSYIKSYTRAAGS